MLKNTMKIQHRISNMPSLIRLKQQVVLLPSFSWPLLAFSSYFSIYSILEFMRVVIRTQEIEELIEKIEKINKKAKPIYLPTGGTK